ncbi:MAG TPA: zinc ribbon domain-containing protein [Spirochaetia bacterium]|nr:zinc ribbon domain-containing protein [Spirochaetaceae bacterium]HPE89134.1 zinc ribbon domain-containing protein [Spirochaetales bacterium]HRW23471.1 zinc ribbon domain-containing protein [Spirochaetia bacterium]
MPTYEYECRACGYTFERVQSMSDEPIRECPECGQQVRRLIFGGSGVIFKGSGFYVNDSKGKNPAAPKAKPGASEAAAPKAAEAKAGSDGASSAPKPSASPEQKPTKAKESV